MITVTKILTFDAGHRVLGHGGKCRHLHGHHYGVKITVEANQLDSLDMVVDFGVIKERIGGWIDRELDHNLLLHPDDPLRSYLEETEERMPFIMTKGNPTAENIATEIYYWTKHLLPDGMVMKKVRVYETPTCYAEYTPPE